MARHQQRAAKETGPKTQNVTSRNESRPQDSAAETGNGVEENRLSKAPLSKAELSKASNNLQNLLASKQGYKRASGQNSITQSLISANFAADEDKTISIQAWRQQALDPAEIHELGIVGSLYESGMVLFKELLKLIKKQGHLVQYEENLQRCLGTLFFWGDGFGAARGELDSILEQSQELRNMTLSICISIAEVISQEGLLQHACPDKLKQVALLQKFNITALIERARCAIDEHDQTANDKVDNMEDILMDLQAYTECLSSLSSSIEYPAKDLNVGCEESVRVPTELEDRVAHQYYVELISSRFPKARSSLVDCLGKCNWERYNRLQLVRKAHAMEDASRSDDAELPTTGKSNASRSLFAESGFHDSGLGTSIPVQSAYALSIASFVSSRAESSHSKLPPLSEPAKRGVPFVCDACNKTVQITRTREWKKHIFQDLQPYVCFIDGCPQAATTFIDLNVWTDHLGLGHRFAPQWKSTLCQLCHEPTGSGRSAVSTHFARHMEEIALAVLPHDTDSSINSDNRSASSNRTRSPSPKERETLHDESHHDPFEDLIVLYAACEATLEKLKAIPEHANPFLLPVQENEAPDYYNVIKNPMDLGTVSGKLKTFVYRSKQQFLDDLNLVWANCLRYCVMPDHPLRKNALHMQNATRRLMPSIPDIVLSRSVEVEAKDYVLNCYCGDDREDVTVLCSKCRSRQHLSCYTYEGRAPADHICINCQRQKEEVMKSQGRDESVQSSRDRTQPNDGTGFTNSNELRQAEPRGEALCSALKNVSEEEYLDTLTSYTNLASIAECQGKYDAGEKMYQRILDVREKVLGIEHPDTLTACTNLASVLGYQGKYDTAEKLYQKVLVVREKVLGIEHPNTLISYTNLAIVLEKRGRYDAAEVLHRKALDLNKKILGKEHPYTVTSYTNLAIILSMQGKWLAAEELHRRVLDLKEKIFGKAHAETLRSYTSLANVLAKQGQLLAAEELHREVLDTREKYLGLEHPDTLKSVQNLASVFYNRKRYEDAFALYGRALLGYERAFGLDHPITVQCRERFSVLRDEVRLRHYSLDEDNVLVKNARRLPSLHQVGTDGHTAHIREPPESGVDPNASVYPGRTTLQSAVYNGHEAAVRAGDSLRLTTLRQATIRGNQGMVQLPLEHGADVNAISATSTTALSEVARGEHSAIADLLVESAAEDEVSPFKNGSPCNPNPQNFVNISRGTVRPKDIESSSGSVLGDRAGSMTATGGEPASPQFGCDNI